MEILRDIAGLGRLPEPVSLALGVFDGVHRGHAQVIASACARPGTPVVATFEPHPVRVLQPGRAPKLLSPLEHKVRLVGALGVRHLLAIPFDRERAAQEAESFVRELAQAANLAGVSVGSGFRFGRGRAGDVDLLRALGAELGFEVDGIAPVRDSGGEVISSTRVRAALEAGDLADAARLLGRDYSLFGHVVRGAALGSGIGFPTANIATSAEQLPPNGVYAVRATLTRETLPGVANLGLRPTVTAATDGVPQLEVHLFDFDGDIYGAELEVRFVQRIRAEEKFDGLEGLKAQISRDVAEARRLLT